MKNTFIIIFFLATTLVFAQVITPIANIQDSVSVYNGQDVTVEGVITIGAGISNNNLLNAFIQDNSGKGILLFDYDITSAYETDIIRGNMLRVTGEVSEYDSVTELKDFTYTVISSGNPDPVATVLDLGTNNDIYEGTLVQVTGTIVDKYYAGGGTNLNIKDEDNNQVTVRVWDSTGIELDDYAEGYILEARGAGGMYNGDFQILVGYQDHLGEGEFVIYPYGDISERIPGEPVNITFTYPLEFANVIMHWSTNREINLNLLEMTPTEANEDIYETDVPAQGEGTMVEFEIIATDTSGTEFTFPEEDTGLQYYPYYYDAVSHIAVLNIPAEAFNPYSGESFHIEFGAELNDKAILRIYNAEGKLERTLFNDIITNLTGINQYDWDGRDKENNLLPLGLYICFLEVIDTEAGNKKTAKAPIVIGAPLK